MGEYYYKVINRIIGKIKQYFWKIVFRKNLKIGNKSVIYPGCHFMIEKNGKIETINKNNIDEKYHYLQDLLNEKENNRIYSSDVIGNFIYSCVSNEKYRSTSIIKIWIKRK